MPSKYLKRVNKKNAHFHIFNRGISGNIIFKDQEDYAVFLGYLQDYLSPPAHPDILKKEFTVKGRKYKGIPHRTKNYSDKIILLAYSLHPNHFHILVQQKTKGYLEKFMRSLTTRFSMYYNKKHHRTGSLFDGPYKSVHIDDLSSLLCLTHHFHRVLEDVNTDMDMGYSSYEDYSGTRNTLWVKPDTIISYFNNSDNKTFKVLGNYRNYIENYELEKSEQENLKNIILEKKSDHVIVSPKLARTTPLKQAQSYSPKITYFLTVSAIFVGLFGYGFNNVKTSLANEEAKLQIVSETPAPKVAGEKTQAEMFLLVKIDDGAEYVNIRKKPRTSSEKIGEALEGETFEFISIQSGWYEVKMDEKSSGWIFSKYIEAIETVEKEN